MQNKVRNRILFGIQHFFLQLGKRKTQGRRQSVAAIATHSYAVGVAQSGYWYFVLKFCYLCGHAFPAQNKGSTKNRSLQFAHKRLTFVQTCANLTRHCSPSSPCGSRRSRPAHPLAKRVYVLRIDMHVVSSCRGRRLTLTDQTPPLASGLPPFTHNPISP